MRKQTEPKDSVCYNSAVVKYVVCRLD